MMYLYIILGLLMLGLVIYIVYNVIDQRNRRKIEEERLRIDGVRRELFRKALKYMDINEVEMNKLFARYHKTVVLKSKQALLKYDYSTHFKENRNDFYTIKVFLSSKERMIEKIRAFIKNNPYGEEEEYSFLISELNSMIIIGAIFTIRVKYITTAGNCLGTRDLNLDMKKLQAIESQPELYMTKTEMKEIEKDRLEAKKKDTYNQVSKIIDKANELKDNLITKDENKTLDNLIANLFDRTVNSIQKIKQLNSEEWNLIDKVIKDVETDVVDIEKRNTRLRNYYLSKDFDKIKETCELLMNSQKEFNVYIEDKINTISKMFGTRITRNETEHEDVYNYVRTYNKTISPFTAELSSAVFGSAENNPIQYLIKYFYPNKSMYKDQIIDLKNLLNELDALKDAKVIIDNYKKDYAQYIANVPSYVLEEDEDGFYSRLGFAVIDENVLNVEYKFVYTSNGGMAQRSFTIPMTEETISELINQLQNKLSTESLAKEQRALMTPKLRLSIKERDNYTCCNCGNSTNVEPNLLLEIDHIIPIAKGGLTVEENLQTLCWKCNRNKGAKIL